MNLCIKSYFPDLWTIATLGVVKDYQETTV